MLAVCERTEHGVDIQDRWRPLDHVLGGGAPLLFLYW